MPWMTSLCWAGSMSGMPQWLIEKCSPFGVTVPLISWCGVRACELRNSPLGLLSARVTSFSNGDGVCTGGVIWPNSRLHGSSMSGSAAAPVTAPPVPTAPAMANPLPNNARRLIRPLPATSSSDGAPRRRLHWPMISSLMGGAICTLPMMASCGTACPLSIRSSTGSTSVMLGRYRYALEELFGNARRSRLQAQIRRDWAVDQSRRAARFRDDAAARRHQSLQPHLYAERQGGQQRELHGRHPGHRGQRLGRSAQRHD